MPKTKKAGAIGLAVGVLVFAVVAVTLIVLAIFKVPKLVKPESWKYYDEYEERLAKGEVDYGGMGSDYFNYQNVVDASPKAFAIVDEAKANLRLALGSHECLNWERFERSSIKKCTLPDNWMGISASYDLKDETLYLFEEGLLDDPDRAREIITHELIHSLTATEENATIYLSEGATQFLTEKIVATDSETYLVPYAFIEVYDETHGRDALIEHFLAGTLGEEIDKDLGRDGVMGNIDGLMRANYDGSHEINQRIILDVYSHYARTMKVDHKDTLVKMLNFLPITPENKEAVNYYLAVLYE